MKKIALIASSVALAATPVLAETQIAVEPTTAESNLGETNKLGLAFAVIAAAVIAGAIFFSGDDGDDEPISA
ncbi:MAG: hypothetical protein ABJP34_00555 [Erythrobacter sp.]